MSNQTKAHNALADRMRSAGEVLTAMQREANAVGAYDQLRSAAALSLSATADAAADRTPDLTAALSGLTVQMDGEVVGRLVASTVSSEIGRAARARRYTV